MSLAGIGVAAVAVHSERLLVGDGEMGEEIFQLGRRGRGNHRRHAGGEPVVAGSPQRVLAGRTVRSL